MATVRPKVMKPVKLAGHAGRVEAVIVPEVCFKSRIEVLEVIPEKDQTAKLTEADVIVSGGRGLRKPENFTVLGELAQLFNGALGASRGAVEEGWIAPSHQVGQTAAPLPRPSTWLWGFREPSSMWWNAGLQDHRGGQQGPDGPVFDVATFGIVADLFEFVPAFIKKIKQERGDS